jgi:hypothetical protein
MSGGKRAEERRGGAADAKFDVRRLACDQDRCEECGRAIWVDEWKLVADNGLVTSRTNPDDIPAFLQEVGLRNFCEGKHCGPRTAVAQLRRLATLTFRSSRQFGHP